MRIFSYIVLAALAGYLGMVFRSAWRSRYPRPHRPNQRSAKRTITAFNDLAQELLSGLRRNLSSSHIYYLVSMEPNPAASEIHVVVSRIGFSDMHAVLSLADGVVLIRARFYTPDNNGKYTHITRICDVDDSNHLYAKSLDCLRVMYNKFTAPAPLPGPPACV